MKKAIFLVLLVVFCSAFQVEAKELGKVRLADLECNISSVRWDATMIVECGKDNVKFIFPPTSEDMDGLGSLVEDKGVMSVYALIRGGGFDSDTAYQISLEGDVVNFINVFYSVNKKIKEANK